MAAKPTVKLWSSAKQSQQKRKTMNRLHSLPYRSACLSLAIAAIALCTLSSVRLTAADSKPAKAEKVKKPEKKQKLTGAELYAIHCNRCHAERYPTERTDAQWKTIMMHMQTRAQLPGKDAKAILKYLQENN
jgi:mono/diheme cytochrome c family protein